MKRGSSVLQPASPSKRLTKTHHTSEHQSDLMLLVSSTSAASCSSPFPAATSLFSPDVSSKMASDLLIRLSEATQKARVHPGSRVEAGPQRQESRGGQQDEPGQALSPDGPGASPEPPSLSHTPDTNGTTETLASDMLRKLAERQEVNGLTLRIKEEEEPMEVDSMISSGLNRPITDQLCLLPQTPLNLYTLKTEDTGKRITGSLQTGAKMADRSVLARKIEDNLYSSAAKRNNTFELKVKQENCVVSGTKMVEQLLVGAKMDDQFLFKAKVAEQPVNGAKIKNGFMTNVEVKSNSPLFSEFKTEETLFFGAKMEDQFASGAKMADQCLRAVLWQDMSVNLASTLLHQLSERVSKSNGQMMERTPTPVRSSPALEMNVEQNCLIPPLRSCEPLPETSVTRAQITPGTYFYRCHVCGFETEGRSLFQSHMTEHRQWERALFSLHCCVCDLSTNQEPEMTAHVDTHLHRDTAARAQIRCPPTPPAVAVETAPEPHRCRICQRSFPGQQELLVHFQGHRQGNQYRCDRCGHLTRTANKLVEHVRVHTGERPFTCSLCPYSAKRRDSLRLHCKVKHPDHVHAINGHVHAINGHVHAINRDVRAPGLVHAPGHRDNQRAHTQRLHTPLSPPASAPPPLWDHYKELSPLLPITTLLNIRPRPLETHTPETHSPVQTDQSEPSSSSVPSSSKQSYMCYLGLTSSL